MQKLRLVLAFVLVASVTAFAQTATILGTVTDATGFACTKRNRH
jgi:hypothetical protein